MHQWYPRGQAGARRAYTGFGGPNSNAFTITNEGPNEANNPSRLHLSSSENVCLLARGGPTIVGKEWGGPGSLIVEGDASLQANADIGGKGSFRADVDVAGNIQVAGRIGVLGQPATPRTNGWLEEARVVRQVFDWVGQERATIGEVARRLTAAKELTRMGRTVWDRTTVWDMLKNPAYKGVAPFGKTQAGPLGATFAGSTWAATPAARC